MVINIYLKKRFLCLGLSILNMSIMPSCQTSSDDQVNTTKPETSVIHPEWVKDAVIYELNVRQYSTEGTFRAVEEDLERLKDLGIDVLWIMPVHPIGEVNRKGELGSYYSVKDYYDVNPEFGTLEDFKSLVKAIHEQGMKIIIDWVPNHTAWDNPLAVEHPEFYDRTDSGEFKSPFDWTDVIQLDYDQQGLRDYMTEVLQYWVREIDIDGFRFDVAHMIPVDFFDSVRTQLLDIKEVFLLAEADQPFLHRNAMNMSYDWRLHHIMNEVAAGNKNALAIKEHFAYVDSVYPENAILMEFTSNHDENSWNGTVYERLGDAVECFTAFSFIIPGMPLIYNGQEACMDKRLKFFERDPIEWKECELNNFYKSLINLKTSNKALWSGDEQGSFGIIDSPMDENILVIKRENQDNKVIAIFNLSQNEVNLDLAGIDSDKNLMDYFDKDEAGFPAKGILELKAWDYKVYVK